MMASHTSADVTCLVVCNYYVVGHKNVACTHETLHVRFAVRIAGNAVVSEATSTTSYH